VHEKSEKFILVIKRLILPRSGRFWTAPGHFSAVWKHSVFELDYSGLRTCNLWWRAGSNGCK